MKALIARIALRAARRAVRRRSPRAELVGGSALAAIATGLMIVLGVPESTAVLIGPNLGVVAGAIANLLWGDDVVDAPAPSIPSTTGVNNG